MTERISATWDTLFDQSLASTTKYMKAAERELIRTGLNFTATDIVALAKVMAYDYRSAVIAVSAQRVCDSFDIFREN